MFLDIHIGLDDLDTPVGGCTTYVTYRLVKTLLSRFKNSIKLLDYPNLVRLNPAIPFKTRGNGGTAVRIKIHESLINELIDCVEGLINELTIKHSPTRSEYGIVILEGSVPKTLQTFYRKAVSDYVTLDYVEEILNELGNVILYTSKPLRRGLVGALASIGWIVRRDVTYELLVYRVPEWYGRERCVDPESVRIFDSITKHTYLNYDYSKDKVLISPRGPDPVLYGVRGDDPLELLKALEVIRVCEPIEGWMIFKTNQCTNDHYVVKRASRVRTYQAVCIDGEIIEKPRTLRGGVTLARVLDDKELIIAAFKEGGLNTVLQGLREGDFVRVCGVAKPWENEIVLQVEKIVVRYINRLVYRWPRCPRCGSRLKSAGRGKGLKCLKCGYRTSKSFRIAEDLIRSISEGVYLPKPHAFKHLMKPLSRYGREEAKGFEEPLSNWIH